MNLSKQQTRALTNKLHQEMEQASKLEYEKYLKNKQHPDYIGFINSKDSKCLLKIKDLFTHSIVKEVKFVIKSSVREYDYDIVLRKGDGNASDVINKTIVNACHYNRRYNYDQIENAIVLATIDCEDTDKLIAQVKRQLGLK